MIKEIKALKGKGHFPTLLAAFLYFDFSFMVWTMLGPLAPEIAQSIGGLSAEQISTLLALPILGGALLRIVLGFLVDNLGPKKTALIAQSIVAAALWYAYFRGENITYMELLLVALALGFAGASFAVALPQAGQWYPPNLQGVVLGIAGAGNIGVVIDFLFAPKIAEIWGWPAVFLVGAVLSTFIFVLYFFMAKDAPIKRAKRKLSDYIRLLKDKDTYWFMLFYAVSFGGFVGFASYMKVYLLDVYADDMAKIGLEFLKENNIQVIAGYFGALTIFAGAVLRPVGGAVADRIGGVRALYFFYSSVFILALINALFKLPFLLAVLDMFLIMSFLGAANGAVFQLVPQRFSKEMGIMTGLVGAAGGLGGSAIIKALGASKEITGDYSAGFIAFSLIVLVAILGLTFVKTRWRTTWGVNAGGRI